MNEATNKPQLPAEGGSFHRLPDGSLQKRDAAPKDKAASVAQLAADAAALKAHEDAGSKAKFAAEQKAEKEKAAEAKPDGADAPAAAANGKRTTRHVD